jgi:hypothetical protein
MRRYSRKQSFVASAGGAHGGSTAPSPTILSTRSRGKADIAYWIGRGRSRETRKGRRGVISKHS